MEKQVDSSNIGGLLEALITKIKAAFWRKSETSELSIDNAPTSGSNNLVKSGGVYSALADKYEKPSTGIPASDLASGVIPDVSNFITKSVNDLVNYYTKSETYTRDEVAALIGAIQQFHYETYASRQDVVSPANNVLYLIGPTGSGTDKYEEYVYDSTKQDPWVKIGDTSIDLSGYVTTQALNNALSAYTTTSDLTTLLAGKQDTIDAQHKLDYSLIANTPTIPTEVFVATYGTTTQSEILAAVAAGQLPVCKYGGNLYVYVGESSADYSQFTSVLYDTAYRIYVKNSTWGSGSYEVYSKPSGGIPASDIADGVIPAAPVNADWNASSGLAQILNKPTIPTQYAGSPTAGGFANKAVAIPFGNVDSTSTATELTATVDNFPTTLTDGVCAYIRNNAVASASGFTLNINGTGALPVYQTMADASRSTTIFSASTTYLFVYNSTRVEGGCWDIYYGYNSNDNTIGYILRTNYMSLPTTSACYRYRLLFTSADGTKFVPANASSSTSATTAKTTTQTPIDPFGSIRYYNYTSAVSSGSMPDVAHLCEQYQVTLGYSFNRTGAALTLTSWKPVYIKCAPQSDGSAIIDAENPYVQDLPTTADGKIYIFLGVATSATQVEVVFHHPVYYHDGTDVRIWTGRGVDSTPTQNSKNLVTSGGIYDALQGAGTVQDVTVGGKSVVTNKVAVIPDIPDEIDTVVVTVDANTGTPSAAGSVSGNTLSLAFHNLKGDTGATGPKGPQGNTGSSVDYPFTLANNLTTDDPSVALSAAQGVVIKGEVDELSDAIDLQEETRTVTKTLVAGTDYTTDYGYCPSAGGQLGTSQSFRHSSLINILAGDIINVKCAGPNSIAIIAKQRDSSNYDALVVGTVWNTVKDYTYTANEPFQLLVSWQITNSSPDAVISITRTETVTISAISELQDDMADLQASQESLEDAVNEVKDDVVTVVNDDLTTDLVTGKYITHAGSVVTNASFSYKEFPVRAGTVVVFSATIHQNVAAIAKKRIRTNPASANVGFIELVPATSTNPETFTYTAEEDMTIVVSFNNTATRSIVIKTSNVGANTLTENEILGGEETYKKAQMLQDINLGYMFDKIAVIGDSLASGRVEGIVGQPDAAGHDFYNFSWLSFLSKRWRCSAFKNYSNAGADTASWLQDWLPVMQADPVVYDAYFIALGTNNEYDESNPPGDQTNYDAFIERYNDILDAVRAKAPNAVIFILSLYEPRAGYGNATLQEIAETRMATDDGVFYLDFVNETGYFRYSPEVNWRGHFSSVGYVYVASAIARMVDEIIWNNKTEEFWIQFAKYHNGS